MFEVTIANNKQQYNKIMIDKDYVNLCTDSLVEGTEVDIIIGRVAYDDFDDIIHIMELLRDNEIDSHRSIGGVECE